MNNLDLWFSINVSVNDFTYDQIKDLIIDKANRSAVKDFAHFIAKYIVYNTKLGIQIEAKYHEFLKDVLEIDCNLLSKLNLVSADGNA